MPNSRFCLGELSLEGAAVVGAGALLVGAAVVGAGALLVGAAVESDGGFVATAAVGSAAVGATTGSGLPPQLARIGSAIASIMAAALIRIRAKGIFTICLLVERNMSICSTCFIVHEIARMLKCAHAEAMLIAILFGNDDA